MRFTEKYKLGALMNVERYLILIKQEDKTADVIRYEYQSGLVNVIFKTSDKIYSYARNDFKFYKDPKKIDVDQCDVFVLGGRSFCIFCIKTCNRRISRY